MPLPSRADRDLLARCLVCRMQAPGEQMELMKSTDVFTPQQIPTVTLVTDHLSEMSKTYKRAIPQGKLIRVVGPSKSGKTVFIQSAAGDGNIISITGAGVTSPDILWTRVLHAIGSDVAVATERSESKGGGYKVGTKVEGSVLVAKADASGELSRDRGSSAAVTQDKAVDLYQLVVQELAGSGLTIFVDDFHYVPSEVQVSLARQIKQAVQAGVQIAAAAVPFRSEDVLRANDDLQGRIEDFDFKYWSSTELVRIAKLGFVELNINCSEAYALRLASEAAGSPQLMQSLCLETCFALDVDEKSDQSKDIPDNEDFFTLVCSRVAAGVDFSTTISVMKDGPLTRGSARKAYVLHDGTAADVYQILVRAIALDPPSLHFSYAEMQSRVASVCNGAAPHFADPCSHMARLVNDRFEADKIDWDAELHMLSIRDPYLLFGVRWGRGAPPR